MPRLFALSILLFPSVALAHGGHPEGAGTLVHFILPAALAFGAVVLGSKVLGARKQPARVSNK